MGAPPARRPFQPTHVVSGRGLPAWDQPDPTKASAQTLNPWSEVQVVDQIGSWANIVTVDGWEGWVDAHQLMPRAGGRRR